MESRYALAQHRSIRRRSSWLNWYHRPASLAADRGVCQQRIGPTCSGSPHITGPFPTRISRRAHTRVALKSVLLAAPTCDGAAQTLPLPISEKT